MEDQSEVVRSKQSSSTAVMPGAAQKIIEKYQTCLERHPVLTKALTR